MHGATFGAKLAAVGTSHDGLDASLGYYRRVAVSCDVCGSTADSRMNQITVVGQL